MATSTNSDNHPSSTIPSTPSYVVTVHAADEQALASARSSLGATRELSAGGGATAAVVFASSNSPIPNSSSSSSPSTSSSSSSSSFDPALYFSSLRTRTLGRVLLVSPLLPSTQDLVQKANPSSSSSSSSSSARLLPDGAVCVADEQASGRGRGANAWTSPRGCLAFSLSSDVRVPGTRLPFVQYLVSLALVRAARAQLVEGAAAAVAAEERATQASSTSTPASSAITTTSSSSSSSSSSSLADSIRIKWPNDVYARTGAGAGAGAGAGKKKLAGVLCHSSYVSGNGSNSNSSGSGGNFFRLTAGVGINVTNAPPPGAESLAGILSSCSLDRKGDKGAGQGAAAAEEGGEEGGRRGTFFPSREALLASTLSELEPLLDALSRPEVGFSDAMRREYEACWLHSGQVVEVDEGVELMEASASASASTAAASASTTAASAAAAEAEQQQRRRQKRPRVRITGLSPSGFLAAVDAEDGATRYELHPDGNSLDFFEGLVRRKAA